MPPRSPQEIMDRIADAVNGHDLDAFIALHEPDAVVVPPGGERTRGVEAIREVLTPLFESSPSTEIELHGFLETGDLAMSHTHFVITLTRPTGEFVVKKGMGTVVTRRQPDGTWRIVFDYPIRQPD